MRNRCVLSVTSGLESTQSEHAKLSKDVEFAGKYHEHHLGKKKEFSTRCCHALSERSWEALS